MLASPFTWQQRFSSLPKCSHLPLTWCFRTLPRSHAVGLWTFGQGTDAPSNCSPLTMRWRRAACRLHCCMPLALRRTTQLSLPMFAALGRHTHVPACPVSSLVATTGIASCSWQASKPDRCVLLRRRRTSSYPRRSLSGGTQANPSMGVQTVMQPHRCAVARMTKFKTSLDMHALASAMQNSYASLAAAPRQKQKGSRHHRLCSRWAPR